MRNNTSLDLLQQTGKVMTDGEFTGAGKRIPLKSIKIFITSDDVILSQDVSTFVPKGQAAVAPTLGDLSAFHWQGMLIEMNQVKAIVISK